LKHRNYIASKIWVSTSQIHSTNKHEQMKRFKNKVALITGGARGIGANTVKRFIAEGAKVYFTDILEAEGERLSYEYKGQAVFIKHDVTNENDWKNVIMTIDKEAGRLDVLVNNAGIAIHNAIGEMTLDKYMKTVNVNQVSVFLGLTYTLPLLKKGESASLINISSVAGLRANPLEVAYASSKFAVRAMTQVAALEFAPFKIRVNSVYPGLVETPMVMLDEYKEAIEGIKQRNPLKRIATVEDVSNMILFLASDEATYITAGEFVVDGGTMAGYKL
jgi:3alpha(or 20beta)-hydroxysteroid dehydrogenase